MSYFGFRPYVPVAKRRRQAVSEMEKLKKQGRTISPVVIEGRTIARNFWGKAWCENLERYSDYANRLPRGRTYVRNGSVVDLQIARVIKQVVEVQKRCLPLIVGVQFCEGFEFGDELRKGACRNRGYEGCVGVAAPIVIRLRRIGELRSGWFAEALSCRRAFQFPFFLQATKRASVPCLQSGGTWRRSFATLRPVSGPFLASSTRPLNC